MKQTPGTELTESAIGLDRQGRIDLQLRIEALGNELGRIDGNIGPQTRQAIGIWQVKNGLPQTILSKEFDNRIAGAFVTANELGAAHWAYDVAADWLIEALQRGGSDESLRDRAAARAPEFQEWFRTDASWVAAQEACRILGVPARQAEPAADA